MSKRALEDDASEPRKQVKFDESNIKKHTLDSDEEDDDKDKYNVLDDNEIEGEEEGSIDQHDGEIRVTAFNMDEEMEMGHFDRDGHFIWKNEKEVRDNWLDNVDWQRIKKPDASYKLHDDEKGLGDESDEDEIPVEQFDLIKTYRQIITYLKPNETINKALKRLGGDLSKLSSIERLKRKKAGTLGTSKEVTELTELANAVLTEMGNMDIYQETYENITQRLTNHDKKNKSKAGIVEAELDMYADDFDECEKNKSLQSASNATTTSEESETATVTWEFKRDRDKDELEGPYDSEQMNKWANEGHFKTGVWVRKCGSNEFYSSNRVDFELYL